MPSAPGWAGSLHRVSAGGCAVCGLRTPREPLGGLWRVCGGGPPALPVGLVRLGGDCCAAAAGGMAHPV